MKTKVIDSSKFSTFSIHTTDGELGKIKDYYFDEVSGHIRYLVVDTEKFLFRNLVLVSPMSIKEIHEDDEAIYLNLSNEKLENSPPFNSVDTVSRLYEQVYNEYFAWPNYWESMHGPWVIGPFGIAWHHYEQDFDPLKQSKKQEELEKCHLLSLNNIRSFSIQGHGQHFGHIQSLILNIESFKIDYWVIDTVNFFPSKLVLFPYEKDLKYNWMEKLVEVNYTKSEIKQAPAYHVGDHGIVRTSELEQATKYYGT